MVHARGETLKTLDGFILPANIDTHKDVMLVPDLSARITLLGKNDKVITHLGEDPEWREQVLKESMKLRSHAPAKSGWPANSSIRTTRVSIRQAISTSPNGCTPGASPN